VQGNSENHFVRTHVTSNRQSAGAWERFAAHRRRVTDLALCHWPDGGVGCVLGAGNLNDLDLRSVLRVAAGIHLVDLDRNAVVTGLRRQGVEHEPGLVVHPSTDITGILHLLPAAGARPARGDVDRLAAALEDQRLPLCREQFGLVLSAGVLTQLFQSLIDSPLTEADTIAVTLRLRDQHLRELVGLLEPGGTAVLVTDVVSTSTAPSLLRCPEPELEEAMAGLVSDANFFTGANPYRITGLLEDDEWWRSRVGAVRLHDPWLWAVTADRHHLTCAITFRRR
jgi:hypothetical protein